MPFHPLPLRMQVRNDLTGSLIYECYSEVQVSLEWYRNSMIEKENEWFWLCASHQGMWIAEQWIQLIPLWRLYVIHVFISQIPSHIHIYCISSFLLYCTALHHNISCNELLLFTAVNSLWPDDAIWRQRSESALAQVMACCLTAPSHYLNQCWFIISKVQWHPSESKFRKNTSDINHWKNFEIFLSKFSFKYPMGQWVNSLALWDVVVIWN